MNEAIKLLLEYQTLDAELDKEQQLLYQSEAGLNYSAARKAFDASKDKIVRLADEVSNITNIIKGAQDTANILQEKLASVDAQEYSPRAEEKTAAVLDEIKTTLDALRSGHDKLGRIQQVFTETMRAGATAQADVAKTKAAFDIDKQEGYNIKFKDKIEQKAALEAKIKAIHPQLLQRFNDIKREIKQKKALCSKPVNKYSSSGFCGGCGHEVKNQVNAKITEHGIAECPNCRCLLYTE